MRKGITPIIATIVLLLITVALAGAAYTFLSSYMGTYTEKSFILIPGSLNCANKNISMIIKNMGTTDLTGTDFLQKTANNGTSYTLTIPTIASLQTGTLYTYCTNGCTGAYTIRLGTTAGIQSFSITC